MEHAPHGDKSHFLSKGMSEPSDSLVEEGSFPVGTNDGKYFLSSKDSSPTTRDITLGDTKVHSGPGGRTIGRNP